MENSNWEPMERRAVVLVVDDEIRSLEAIRRILDIEFEVLTAESADQAFEILENESIQAILCDQRMPGMTGVEFFVVVRKRWPEIGRLLISGYTDVEDIIKGINDGGIYQYITKPWHPTNLLLSVKNAVKLYGLQRENRLLATEMKLTATGLEATIQQHKQSLKRNFDLDRIIRSDQSPINAACEQVKRIAPHNVSALITGESGTGKELFARAIHYNSPRADKPFVIENCAALPDELLSSELFGHKKGSFTGAIGDHVGLFEQADGGTIFLDEIGDVTPAFQVKLLRVLQEGEIRPLGSEQTRRIDVRVVASTNKDLEQEIRKGRFRQDLYYRLATVTIQLPPLRQRIGDIELLLDFILKENEASFGKSGVRFTEEAIELMERYSWPGNVRELQNIVRYMLVYSDTALLGADLLPGKVISEEINRTEVPNGLSNAFKDGSLKERVEAFETMIIKETLIRCQWNKSRAAQQLGVSRVGLRNKLERYALI